jgi:hypothetical protein
MSELSSPRPVRLTLGLVPEELNGLSDRPDDHDPMTTTRSQRRYDHRLRDLVRRTADVTIATDLGILARPPVDASARLRPSWSAST